MHLRKRRTFRAAVVGALLPLAPVPSTRGGGATPPDADWAVGRPAPEVAALRHRLLVTGSPSFARLAGARASQRAAL